MREIIVRHVEAEDAAALHEIYSHPQTGADTLHLPFPSLKFFQERINNIAEGSQMLVATIDGKVVGQSMLQIVSPARRRHVATFGLGVHYNYRGQGVGSALMQAIVDQCDNWLNIKRIELTVFADNQAATALYEKFGFVTEGRATGYAMRHGKLADVLYMARLSPS